MARRVRASRPARAQGRVLLAAFGQRRPTRDLDVHALDLAGDLDPIRELVADIAAVSIEDGLEFDAAGATAQVIRDDEEYSGVRVALDATLHTARLKTKIDVNVGDPIWPAPQEVIVPRLLDGPPLVLRGYPLHMVLAEKLVTAIDRGAANTRWRDVADIYLLTRQQPVAAADLDEAIRRVAAHRVVQVSPLAEVLAGFPDLSQAKWRAWRAKQDLTDVSLPSLLTSSQTSACSLTPSSNVAPRWPMHRGTRSPSGGRPDRRRACRPAGRGRSRLATSTRPGRHSPVCRRTDHVRQMSARNPGRCRDGAGRTRTRVRVCPAQRHIPGLARTRADELALITRRSKVGHRLGPGTSPLRRDPPQPTTGRTADGGCGDDLAGRRGCGGPEHQQAAGTLSYSRRVCRSRVPHRRASGSADTARLPWRPSLVCPEDARPRGRCGQQRQRDRGRGLPGRVGPVGVDTRTARPVRSGHGVPIGTLMVDGVGIPRTHGHLATRDGEHIWYETAGEGPALVFAHGLGGNGAVWYQQVPHFAARYRVVTWDQRGFGRSSATSGRLGPGAAADDLVALLDHLGVEVAHLVGQSMGGWAVLGAAMTAPERVCSLVLACTTAGIPARAAAPFDAAEIGPAGGTRPLGVHPAVGPRLAEIDPARAYLYQVLGTFGVRPADGEFARLLAATVYDADQLADLHVPTLLICGSDDAVMTPARVHDAATRLPHARVVELANRGHSPYFEEPDEWNALVDDFLRSVDR